MVKKQTSGEISIHDDMPEATFARILDGFDISDEVKPKNLKFKNNYCLNDPQSEQLTGS
ncbi:hypothetical protein CICRMM096B_07975 [Citrobacter cronae]